MDLGGGCCFAGVVEFFEAIQSSKYFGFDLIETSFKSLDGIVIQFANQHLSDAPAFGFSEVFHQTDHEEGSADG